LKPEQLVILHQYKRAEEVRHRNCSMAVACWWREVRGQRGVRLCDGVRRGWVSRFYGQRRCLLCSRACGSVGLSQGSCSAVQSSMCKETVGRVVGNHATIVMRFSTRRQHLLGHDHRKSLSLSFQQPQSFFLLAGVEGGLHELQASNRRAVMH
jgi:hypothetical protein